MDIIGFIGLLFLFLGLWTIVPRPLCLYSCLARFWQLLIAAVISFVALETPGSRPLQGQSECSAKSKLPNFS